MQFQPLIFALVGLGILVLLAGNTLNARPRVKKAEPVLVATSLVIVFNALQSTVTGSAEPSFSMRAKSTLHEFYFKKHCENRLGGHVYLAETMATCKRDDFVVDQQSRTR